MLNRSDIPKILNRCYFHFTTALTWASQAASTPMAQFGIRSLTLAHELLLVVLVCSLWTIGILSFIPFLLQYRLKLWFLKLFVWTFLHLVKHVNMWILGLHLKFWRCLIFRFSCLSFNFQMNITHPLFLEAVSFVLLESLSFLFLSQVFFVFFWLVFLGYLLKLILYGRSRNLSIQLSFLDIFQIPCFSYIGFSVLWKPHHRGVHIFLILTWVL